MSRKILTAILLLFAAALVAVPQTMHTFPALDTSNTWTGLNNFTGGLQSSGVAVLTNPVNLATQVTGVLAGANYAAVNLAGGNNPGGVAGTLPGSSMATFVASGASHAPGAVPDPGASAGTTHFLREDATWQTVPPGGVTEMVLGATVPSAVSLTVACSEGGTGLCEETFLPTVILWSAQPT